MRGLNLEGWNDAAELFLAHLDNLDLKVGSCVPT